MSDQFRPGDTVQLIDLITTPRKARGIDLRIEQIDEDGEIWATDYHGYDYGFRANQLRLVRHAAPAEESAPVKTLRDEFAMAAMQSYMRDMTANNASISKYYDEIAHESYRIADSMLAERSKRKEGGA